MQRYRLSDFMYDLGNKSAPSHVDSLYECVLMCVSTETPRDSRYNCPSGYSMDNQTENQAGDSLSGKEGKLKTEDLSATTMRAKLGRRTGEGVDELLPPPAEVEEEKTDDVFHEALMRFGIQI